MSETKKDVYEELKKEITQLSTFPTRVGLEMIQSDEVDNDFLVESFKEMLKEKKITGEIVGSSDSPILIVHSVHF